MREVRVPHTLLKGGRRIVYRTHVGHCVLSHVLPDSVQWERVPLELFGPQARAIGQNCLASDNNLEAFTAPLRPPTATGYLT